MISTIRNLYSRAYLKNKDDILIIVGNKDVSKLKLSTTGELQVEVPYTVRNNDSPSLSIGLCKYLMISQTTKNTQLSCWVLIFFSSSPPIKGVA